MKRTDDLELTYAPMIDAVPEKYGNLYQQACTGDQMTMDTWRETWIKNYKATKDRFGELGPMSFGQLCGVNQHKPMIVLGSGPSLASSFDALRANQALPNPVKTISCLHNLGVLEDEGIRADYFLTLDAGEIVLKDLSEGRKKDAEFYWSTTKDKVLLANIASDPGLFDKWQGKIYLFNCLMPDASLRAEFDKVEKFSHYLSSGGNAGGGCMYAAKALMGSSEIIYVGIDLCFSFDNHFHAYPTQYDNFAGHGIGNVVHWPTVYGNSAPWAATWPSYMNFALWFSHVAINVPGRWASASEGILGAFPEGNLRAFRYGALKDLLETYHISDRVLVQEFTIGVDGKPVFALDAEGKPKRVPMPLKEIFKDSKQSYDMTFF